MMWIMIGIVTYFLATKAAVSSGTEFPLRFPKDFMFGSASAAFQIEGAWNVSGKGASIWDTLTHDSPNAIADHSNADKAALSYYKYEEDNDLVQNIGMQFYRFSISWARIMPTGLANNISQEGIDHYNRVINHMLAKGIIPMVTMYHWDLPQYLQNLGGWTTTYTVHAFREYARVLFIYFGDRVKWWFTLNEPLLACYGYDDPTTDITQAPNIEAPGVGYYQAGHNMILAHAAAYHLYDDEFRATQQGKVSLAHQAFWYEPLNGSSAADIRAAERMQHFTLGYFAQPIYGPFGDYPQVMKDRVAYLSRKEGFPYSRLPEFTPEQIEYVRGTADFYGMNHYTTHVVTSFEDEHGPSLTRDLGVQESSPSWLPASPTSPFISVAPEGIRRQMNFIRDHYGDWDILVTENGYGDAGELEDDARITYIGTYLAEVLKAMYIDQISVIGYTVWSILDSFEWSAGYTTKFGLNYVNFTDPDCRRNPKKSANFMSKVISTRKLSNKFLKLGQRLRLGSPIYWK